MSMKLFGSLPMNFGFSRIKYQVINGYLIPSFRYNPELNCSGYSYFTKNEFPLSSGKNSQEKFKDISEKWKLLSKEEKRSYLPKGKAQEKLDTRTHYHEYIRKPALFANSDVI